MTMDMNSRNMRIVKKSAGPKTVYYPIVGIILALFLWLATIINGLVNLVF